MLKKKLLAAVLTLAVLLGLLPAVTPTAWADGEITTISTPEDLTSFRESVNSNNSYQGITVTLAADINLGGSDTNQWTPIGTQSSPFRGTFDGGSHTISGLKIDTTANYQGLFGCVGQGGTVKNLSVDGTVSGGSKIGGVVGINKGKITACDNSCTVTTAGGSVGGVVGSNEGGTVTNCYNTGAIKGSNLVGGVVGSNDGGTVADCYNMGTVTVIGPGGSIVPSAGGVAGANDPGSVERCYNTGEVTGTGEKARVGGVVGGNGNLIFTRGQCRVTDCYNTGTVTVTAENSQVGGVVGINGVSDNHRSAVTNCYNTGTVTVTGENSQADDVVGQSHTNSTVTNCYYLSANEPADGQGKTEAAFQSGEVAWLLQGGRSPQVWGQALNGAADLSPVLTDVEAKRVHKVTFQVDGTEYATAYANRDGTGTAHPQNPDPRGEYTFAGWWTAQTGGEKLTEETTITNDITVYARFHAHSWAAAWTTNATHHWHECTGTDCPITDNSSKDGYDAHTPGDWIIDQAATLEAAGSRHRECTVCHDIETEPIPKLEHTHQYGAWTSDAANHWHQCTAADCTDLESSKKDSAVHTEDAGTVTKPATSTEKGVKIYQCSVCGRVLRTEDIPELAEPTFSISGTVTNNSDNAMGEVEVSLQRGRSTIAKTTTDPSGKYSFSNVPAGTYNVVAEQKNGSDKITKTILVVLTNANANERNIKMPDGNKNSVVEVKDNTPAVVVGGVDEIAENQEVTPGKTVTVKLTVEKKVEDAVRSDAAAIKRAAIGKTVEFLDFSLTKQVNDQNPEAITDTQNTVLEIVVSYDFSGKKEVTVYRHHGSSAAALANANTKADGTFRLDEGKGLIYIYASKFSTYAIGYTASGSETPDPKPPAPSSGGGSGGGSGSPAAYPPVIEKSFHGKAEVQPRNPERGEKVTVTLTPDTGYQADRLTVTDRNGKPVAVTDEGGGRYTFIQPNGKVTIQAGFRPNDGYAVCPKNSVCPISPYTDASAAAWYHDGIHYCLDHNLMVGLDDHTFAPGRDTSRAMVAVILWRMEGSPLSDSPLPFADVAEGTWYTEAVRWAAASGVISGYDGAVFGPGNPITREQMAAMLYRYEQYRGGGFTGAWTFRLDFEDAAQVSEWAREPMCWMTMNGIIDGIGNNTENAVLAPRGKATRAQTAAMLMRFCTKQ